MKNHNTLDYAIHFFISSVFRMKNAQRVDCSKRLLSCHPLGGNYKSARGGRSYTLERASDLNPKRWMVHTMSLALCWNCIFYIRCKKAATTYDIKKAVRMWNIFCEVVILFKNLILRWHRMSTYLNKGLLECRRFRFSCWDSFLIR